MSTVRDAWARRLTADLRACRAQSACVLTFVQNLMISPTHDRTPNLAASPCECARHFVAGSALPLRRHETIVNIHKDQKQTIKLMNSRLLGGQVETPEIKGRKSKFAQRGDLTAPIAMSMKGISSNPVTNICDFGRGWSRKEISVTKTCDSACRSHILVTQDLHGQFYGHKDL